MHSPSTSKHLAVRYAGHNNTNNIHMHHLYHDFFVFCVPITDYFQGGFLFLLVASLGPRGPKKEPQIDYVLHVPVIELPG